MGKYIYIIYFLSIMSRFNPFNPQQPARPDFFVGREPEIQQFEKFLNQTIYGSPMNMSITGNRGIGKTSLLIKCESIAKANNCLTLRLSYYEGNIKSTIDFSNYLITNLRREFISKHPLAELTDWISKVKPTITWGDIRISMEDRHVVEEISRQRLIKLWNEINKDYKAVVILIDEAESIEKIEGILPFLREVFQRLSENAKFTIILAGKLNFPERMSESFSPLNRFFPAYRLTPLENEDVATYINQKLEGVNVGIDNDALQYIIEKSEGHPYVLVAMLYTLFDSLREEEDFISIGIINRAKEKMDATLEHDFFSPMYHPLTNKAKEVMKIIAANIDGTDFYFKEIVEWSKIERNYVSPYIQELLKKGILNKPERAHYRVFHSLFLDYVKQI